MLMWDSRESTASAATTNTGYKNQDEVDAVMHRVTDKASDIRDTSPSASGD